MSKLPTPTNKAAALAYGTQALLHIAKSNPDKRAQVIAERMAKAVTPLPISAPSESP